MISDDELKKAAEEAELALLNSLPDTGECQHAFSLSFRRKMHRLIRKTVHPVFYYSTRWIASIVLMALLGGTLWLTVDDSARAAFFGWVKERYDTFYSYYFQSGAEPVPESEAEPAPESEADSVPEDIGEYRPTWLPEGYQEVNVQDLKENVGVIYTNGDGKIMRFSYSTILASAKINIEHTNTVSSTVYVGEDAADLYLTQNESRSNAIVWTSASDKIMFYISGFLNEDELVKMAGSVKKKK